MTYDKSTRPSCDSDKGLTDSGSVNNFNDNNIGNDWQQPPEDQQPPPTGVGVNPATPPLSIEPLLASNPPEKIDCANT